MKKALTKLISVTLSLIMVFSTVQPALAYYTGNAAADEALTLTDEDGTAVRVSELWDETYPFGAFAFDVTALGMAEGEDAVVTVYRAGGTRGRATAYIAYSPVLTPNEDESVYYGYGLSGKDIVLEVENPLPIAQYQELGKYPNPERGDASIVQGTDEEGYVLSLSEEADSYQWQALYDGDWVGIVKAESASLPMDTEYIDSGEYDYRCIYMKDGVRYCTDSLRGIEYVQEPEEVLEPMPDDLELNPEPSYTAIALDDKDDLYSGWLFNLTFADGEYKKEIHIHANTDELSELMESATFRIAYCKGGDIYSGSETLLLHVDDKNESTPSTVGFAVADSVTVDKANGFAELLVRRVGGVERAVSVDYTTTDGTAAAGKDYVAASGTLMFYGNVTELPIKIELIDDQLEQDVPLDFTVSLSDLKGDDNCSMGLSEVTVSLINSGTGEADNLASVLYDAETVDLSSIVTEAPTAANSGSEPVVGEQVEMEEEEPILLDLIPTNASDLGTQSFNFTNSNTINFKNQNKGFNDVENLAVYANFDKNDSGGTLYEPGEKTKSLGGTSGGGYSDPITITEGVALGSDHDSYRYMKTEISQYARQYYSNFEAKITAYYAHDTSYYNGDFTYSYSWTEPHFMMFAPNIFKDLAVVEPADTKREGSGALNKNWKIYGKMSNSSTWANPLKNQKFSRTFSNTERLSKIGLTMPYRSDGKHEQDDLNAQSLIWLHYLNMKRRVFPNDAFSYEITTPNDDDRDGTATAPDGCATISNYEHYRPKIELVSGGVKNGTNQVYVGTKIKITAPIVAGLYPKDIYVYRKNGSTWVPFDGRFKKSGQDLTNGITLELISDYNNPLTINEINSSYKFRVVYARKATVSVDLSPSLPRNDKNEVLTNEYRQLFNKYTKDSNNKDTGHAENHDFNTTVTYAYSTFNTETHEYNTVVTTANTATSVSGVESDQSTGNPCWKLKDVENLQWIQFNDLSSNDILLINGTAYPGNAKIYLKESDIVGGLNALYYHSSYQGYINPMTTAISWVQIYFDGNGNGKIDGKYNPENGIFEIDTTSGDECLGEVKNGDTFNEKELTPVKLNNGKYGQYFFQVCYTMTPRCLNTIQEEKDKFAQILPAVTTAIDPKTEAYRTLTKEQKQYNYVVSGKTTNDSNVDVYTSDNHIMFGAEANAKSILSIPAGGDKSPAELDSSGAVYTWSPDWYENNLFKHEAPELVVIKNSVAGETKVSDAEITAVITINNKDYKIRGTAATLDSLKDAHPTGNTGDCYIVGSIDDISYDITFCYWDGSWKEYPIQVKGHFSTLDGLNADNSADKNKCYTVGSDEIYKYDSSKKAWFPLYKYEYAYKSQKALDQMNGYLSSLAGTSRIAMVTQIQDKTTSALVQNKPSISKDNKLVTPDSVTINLYSTSPDAEYLKVMKSDGNEKSKMNMKTDGEGKSEMSEFSMPFDMNFGSNEVAITDYVTILFDENSVGFAISLPLCGYEKEGGQTTGEKKGFTDTNKEAWTQFADFFKQDKFNDKSLKDAFQKKAANSTDKVVKSSKFSVQLSVSAAFIWQYNPLDNGYYFSQFEIGIAGELEFRAQARLTVFPPVYGYIDVSFSLEIKTGLGVIRTSVQSAEKLLNNSSKPITVDLAHYEDITKVTNPKQRSYAFVTDKKALDIKFDGKLNVTVQVSTDSGKTWTDADDLDENESNDSKKYKFISGVIGSDGAAYTQIILRKQDGLTLDKIKGNETYRVVFSALDQSDDTTDITTIKSIREVEKIRDFVHWNGISISPELAFEIGMGLGAELLKLELYIHISVGATFTFGRYNDNYDPNSPDSNSNFMYHPASVESFEFNVGLGIRAVLLFFTYELDLVSYQVTYDGEKWEYGWHFLNDMVENELNERDAGVTVSLPQDKSDSMRIYSPEDNAGEGLSTQAYSLNGAPFQVSGFSSSVNSAVLTDSIPEGSSYKVIRAGHRNFLIYTAAREGECASEDKSMLVMSELTFINESGNTYYGLKNPVDGSAGYIPLDNDATGDLDFNVSVEKGSTANNETPYTLHATWVSYATPSDLHNAPPKPDQAATNGINADNYNSFANLATATDINGEWYRYYLALNSYNSYLQVRAKEAAENTVVKTADWSFTETETVGEESTTYTYSNDNAFTEPKTASTTNYVFLPAASENGDVLFFASTNALDTSDTEYNKYAAYQNAKTGLDVKVKNYLNATKKANLDVFGTQSALNLAIKNGNGNWALHKLAIGENPGETLSNIEFTDAGSNSYYVAYTTEETQYDPQLSGELLTVYRLYLRKVTVNGNNVDWGSPVLIRDLRDYDKTNTKDGVYTSSSLINGKEYESPYVSNLNFLTANIDSEKLGTGEALSTQDASVQTILVFEMNGASYTIPQASLAAIAAGAQGDHALQKIYPFFTPPKQKAVKHDNEGNIVKDAQGNVVYEEVTEGSSGKLQVNINVDDNNNLYAVYVASVPGTTNNALYLSSYDTSVSNGQWGDGIMLAMHDMNTYEASVREGWDLETTEAAYLYGKLGDTANNPTITEANLKGLYGEEAVNKLAAYRNNVNAYKDGDFGDAKSFNFSEIQTVQGSNKDLLVVTMGSLRELEIDKYDDQQKVKDPADGIWKNQNVTKYVVVPKTDNNAIKTTVGTYVVSFGEGARALGDANIAFDRMDFSKDTELYVNITAKNTGTTAFRGSAQQPIKAELKATGQEAALATWDIEDNVFSGQEITLSGYCKALTSDLGNGAKFTLVLTEDQQYTNSAPFEITLFTVESKPDLSVERMELYPESIAGDKTTVYVDFVAANQGSALASNVYAQFSYKGADGQYYALDISDNTLKIDDEKALAELLSTQDTVNKDPQYGYLALESYSAVRKDGNDKYVKDCHIEHGYGKRVHGTINIGKEVFSADESGHAQIKVELISDNSSLMTMAVDTAIEATHNEYYTANNASTQSFEAFTAFSVAHSIVIPLGSTTRVPFTAISSRGTKPVINVEEIENEDGFNIGILNFKQNSDNSTSGKVSGYLSFTPVSLGNGVIHVTDLDTNSTFSIAFEVTDSVDGIDIYKDNGSFTFHNINNSVYDDEKTGQDWIFPGVNKWGEGSNEEAPLRNNLAIAKSGAYFTFNSVAKSIDLYFQGKISVKSTNPKFSDANGGSSSIIVENTEGGKSFTEIQLGENIGSEGIYEVTIKALSENTEFDRLAEKYDNNKIPTPSADISRPNFYWSRSFPDTASVAPGTEIPIKLYVLDNNGIASISVNGEQISNPALSGGTVQQLDDNQLLWCYNFTGSKAIRGNGKYTIVATDISGNTSTEVIQVDWFLANPTGNQDTVNVPLYNAAFFEGTNPLGDKILKQTTDLTLQLSKDNNSTKDATDFAVQLFKLNDDGSVEFSGIGSEDLNPSSFPVSSNGIYYVRAEEHTHNTWSAQVISFNQIDNEVPVASLAYNANEKALEWISKKAKASAVADITTVTINDKTVNTENGKNLSGSFKIDYSGKYTIYAKDAANLEVNSDKTVSELGIALPTGNYITTKGNMDENNPDGKVTVDLTGITGGYYDSSLSDEANNSYKSKYTAVLVKASDVTAEQLESDASRSAYIASLNNSARIPFGEASWTNTWTGLAQGDYKLIISDAGDGGFASEPMHLSTVVDIYVPGELPRVTAIAKSNEIEWTAQKDASAVYDINNVTVNGYQVNGNDTGKDLSGSFDIAFSGKYTVAANDINNKSDSKDASVTDSAIVLPANAAKSTAVWDNISSNGTISLNLKTNSEIITGGYYDSQNSVPASNEYYGSYKSVLITPAMLANVADNMKTDEALISNYATLFPNAEKAQFSKDNWTHEWTNLEPGEHIIIITDTGDGGLDAPPAEHASTVLRVNVDDDRVRISGVTLNATTSSSPDGKIVISNVGGFTGLMEFALISEDDLDDSVIENDNFKTYKDAERKVREIKYLISKDTGNDPDKTRENAAELAAAQARLESLKLSLLNVFVAYAKNNSAKINWTLSDYGLKSSTQKATFDSFFASNYNDIVPYILNGLASNTDIVDKDNTLEAAYEAHNRAVQELSAIENDPNVTKEERTEKREALDSAKKALVAAFKAYAEADPDSINWLLDDYTLQNNIQGRTFEDLTSGDYYVIARKIYGAINTPAIDSAHDALDEAYKKYRAASDVCSALEKVIKATKSLNTGSDKDKEKQKNDTLKEKQEALSAAEEVLDATKESYVEAYAEYVAAVTAISSAEYAAQNAYWNGADVISVVVNSNPRRMNPDSEEDSKADSISNISLSENGSVVFTVKAGEPLTSADQAKIRESNATTPIIISNEKVSVAMPAGTVTTEGFDINLMIADTTNAKPGMVVEYTDKNGSVKTDILGVVGNGTASYIASEEGTYRIVKPSTSFSDIDGLWSEDSIKFVTGRKMFLGTGDGKFSPNATMSRAMFVTVLWRVAGSPEQSGSVPFSDVTADWCADAVSWASTLGIVSGYSDGRFGQDDPVTREQMCVFITRSMEKLGWKLEASNNNRSDFKDENAISDWATGSVDICADLGLINGFENGSFAPHNNATRGETSAILERFVQKVVEYLCK